MPLLHNPAFDDAANQAAMQQLVSQANFDKDGTGLLPAIVQHAYTGEILMQAWMDQAALNKTIALQQATFFSRSKQRLWTKGETSGNFLTVLSINLDCDQDSLLLQAVPVGAACHTGAKTCWHDPSAQPFLNQLTQVIEARKLIAAQSHPQDNQSYTASLFQSGRKRIAQKVGEEGVEVALAAMAQDKEELINEAADLMFHLMVLLSEQQLSLEQVQARLAERHQLR